MKAALPSRRSCCPIACALDIVGDRWTLLVLRDIVMARRRYFQELLAGNEAIASNILASRLKRLEGAKMIIRRRDAAARKRVIYEPTEKSLDLLPLMIELIGWGLKHDRQSRAPAPLLRRLAEDRDGWIAELRSAHLAVGPREGRPASAGRPRAGASRR